MRKTTLPPERALPSTDPSRRRLVLGGAVLGATMAVPGLANTALAAVAPVIPGVKPDQPFRLGPGMRPGLRPEQPPRPVQVPEAVAQTRPTIHRPSGGEGPVVVRNAPSTASVPATPNTPTPSAVRRSGVTDRALWLDNINTGETIKVSYLVNGHYQPEALKALNWLMRDRRTDEVTAIDVALLDLLDDIRHAVGTQGPIKLISGYRSPATNTELRQHNRAVATKSYHTKGMAADIAIPGASVPTLFQLAANMGRGGVGDYPGSGFVHVDVGPPRTW